MRAMFPLTVLTGALLLSACGIKGPLYDPHTQPPRASRSQAVPAQPAATQPDHSKPTPSPDIDQE